MNSVVLYVVGVSGILAVLVILLGAAAQLRDEAVNQGWISVDSRLGRMAGRAQRARTAAILHAIGLSEPDLQEIRSTRDTLPRQARRFAEEIRTRPDKCLVRRLRGAVYQLEPPYSYKGSEFYADVMGAIFYREDHEPSLEQIFVGWLELLRAHDIVRSFDCIVAPKDGNPLLAAAVAKSADKPLILVKGEQDGSRVRRPQSELAHETDFEGMKAFKDSRAHPIALGRRFRAVIIDDCCSVGSTIGSVVRRFNTFADDRANALNCPFDVITDAIVLFRVKSANSSNGNFTNIGLSLHALIAVGPNELETFASHNQDYLVRNIEQYKDDEFACAASRALLATRERPAPLRRGPQGG